MGKYKLNPLKKTFDLYEEPGYNALGTIIPQLDEDPETPEAQTAWILRTHTSGANAGVPLGLLLVITSAGEGAENTYELSYRTIEETTVRVALT